MNDPQLTRKTSPVMFRYLLVQFMIPLVCCAVGFCMLFLITDVFDDLGDFLEAKASGMEILRYFLMRQPVNLVNVLPMSVLLAVSYVLGTLGRHHEITAVRASGISMVRFCLPIWCMALVLSGLLLWLNESIAPRFAVIAQETWDRLVEGESSRADEKAKLAFRNEKEHRYWFFESFNPRGKQIGVSIKQFAPETQSLNWEIRAATAEFKDDAWTFGNGYRFTYAENEKLPVKEEPFDTLTVDKLSESPRNIFSSLRPVEELTLREILRLLDRQGMSPSTRDIFWTTVWYRLSFPTACLTAALLGVGFGTTRERRSTLKGFATAIGLMILFYIVNQSAGVLGKYGILPPIVAGCAPSILFVVGGAVLVYKRR